MLVAGVACVAYVAMCATIGWRVRMRRRRGSRTAGAGGADGTPLLVAYASQTGTGEQIARQTAAALRTAGVPVTLLPFDALDTATLRATEEALLIVSTYGEGDPPDPAAAFVARLQRDEPDLGSLHFGLLALGDRSYAHFCGFGRGLDAWLQQRGARPIFPRIDVDKGDATALQEWRHRLSHVAGTADLPDWQGPPFESWTLRARSRLNEGSVGAPLYRIDLEPPAGRDARWEAGDLLQVEAPGEPVGRPREYSIGSLPADGAVQLLVRLECRADGSHGLVSGWLTGQAPPGAPIRARLRSHANFHIDANAQRDLVLIGNGTGLAGLRAHLKQRLAAHAAGAPPRRQWLVFGERQAAHDGWCMQEIAECERGGVLTRVDLVYSRDAQADRYVQDRLRSEAPRLREWVAAGAALYVCGSLEGMAAGVDAALQEILGPDSLEALRQQRRYRRDVY